MTRFSSFTCFEVFINVKPGFPRIGAWGILRKSVKFWVQTYKCGFWKSLNYFQDAVYEVRFPCATNLSTDAGFIQILVVISKYEDKLIGHFNKNIFTIHQSFGLYTFWRINFYKITWLAQLL